MKRTDKGEFLVINEKISKNLKRKADVVELELLEKKRKSIEYDGHYK